MRREREERGRKEGRQKDSREEKMKTMEKGLVKGRRRRYCRGTVCEEELIWKILWVGEEMQEKEISGEEQGGQRNKE